MNKFELIAFALDFSSFLVKRKEVAEKINKIILFGSVARGDFDKESDVDIFIDSDKEMERTIKKILSLYNSSKQKEFWEMIGIRNPISVKIGELDNWRSIKRSVLTDGIILYGKYEELPEEMQHYALFKISLEGKRNKKIAIWRKLYGYKQKIKKKSYETEGLLKKLDGRKLERGIFVIPIKNIQEMYLFLRKHKINYEIFEVWSDSLNRQ